MDYAKIEKKWQKRWEAKNIFEAEPNKQKKYFVTFPYPYVNGAPHIGHSYSAFRCDAIARFKRMQGYNVLFPQGFHATGEPIVGAIERLKKSDEIQKETFKTFGADEKDIQNFIKKGPEFMAKFWMKKWIDVLKKSGYSADWRRTFITTTMTPTYSRFIEWQYNTLKKMGYVVQGTHPVIWCPKCKSPTGDHDRLEGEGESPVDYVILKFQCGDFFLPAATLRPETIFGVVNMWVNPKIEYVKAKINEETWLISEQAAEKLKDQLKDVEIIERISGESLLGKKCLHPLSNKEIPVLPANFVDPDAGTGIVMSVPSHAPYDWVALKELIDRDELRIYGLNSRDVEPISLIQTAGFGEHPAIEICEKIKIETTKQAKELDEATSIVYKKEFHLGVLKENCDEYSGLPVNQCKEKLSRDFIKKGIADVIWDCNKVVCRCTTKCHVKILENQWFLKFSDSKWKSKARKCVKNMDIYPEEARVSFLNTIDWLKDKACARKSGLGTKMPWDREWIIETLSDSTIYMAYYTIAKTINEKKINAKNLTDDVFNFVFLGKGNINKIAKAAKLNRKIIMEMKKEFDYFYPVDMRNSGKDNLHNHLIFYIFHHTALWKEKKWPKAIGVNGYVKIEKDKMSKSKGNVLPLADAIKNYGADMTRINIVSAGEGMYDAEWHVENIKSLRNRYDFLFDIIKEMDRAKSGKRSTDAYIENKINECINNTKESYECLNFRSGVQTALFESTNALRWYLRRVGDIKYANMKTLHESIKKITLMLAPITPHLCEELWSMLGEKGFVSLEKWPKARKIKENYNLSENFIKQIIDDAEEIKKIANISKPKTITLFIAEDWKFGIYKKVFESSKDVNEIIKEIMSSGKYGKATVFFIQNLYKRKNELKEILQKDEQFKILEEAKRFIESETKCAVHLLDADKSENQKAKNSSPQKPGILIE